jgi:hypothetical protein
MGGTGLHATAFRGLLMLLQVVAMDRQAPCATPDSARHLEARREALRTWTARGKQPPLAEEEGRCHIPHLHGSRSQQNVVLWI